MSYSAEISRANPTCFVFVIDQSRSMADPFPAQPGTRKADGVSDALNRQLQELVLRCAKSEGIRDYMFVAVIGYGARVGPALSGALTGKQLVSISEIANSPTRIEERTKKVDDGAGGLAEQKVKFPVWFDPVADGGTPMCQALTLVPPLLKTFLAQHPDCFPPVVIHFTDGEYTDSDPTAVMREITSLSSTDGNVLLFNNHISSSAATPIAFPVSADNLPDKYAQLLFDTSSVLTPHMSEVAREYGLTLVPGAKGFTFNADLVLVIQALDIGTRASNLR